MVIYDDVMGTIPGKLSTLKILVWNMTENRSDHGLVSVAGSHFHKCCTNRSCGLTQYYGYYTTGGSSGEVLFNSDWESPPYFVSSRDTVFCRKLLERLNASIVIGQQSFKQCADTYNFLHKYTGQARTLSQ